MQSDWHRYNLKRRVASLPPLSSAIFAEKVIANKASAEATANRAAFQRRCDPCEKVFYSEGAYVNHLGSQKHRVLAARLDARAGTETDSLVDSTFSLGEPMEIASTTTESTMNGDVVDPRAETEFEEVVEGLKTANLGDKADPLEIRPVAPTPTSALQQIEHPISPADKVEHEKEHRANPQQCLFCNYISPTDDLNIHHMGRQHGFFIPEREYLANLGGLINFVSETILLLHQCLFCHKNFHTPSGVQTHMRDRGHCMIAYSTEEEQLEIGEFYDFRATYSDEDTEGEEDASEANGGVSLGVTRSVKTTTQDANGEDVAMEDDDDEGDWESDSTLSSVPTDEITSVPIDHLHKVERLGLSRHHSHTDPRPHKNTDGFHSHAHRASNAVYHDDYELHLPSGRTAGHRSLNKFYRQNLKNYPSIAERVEREESQRMLEAARNASDSDADDEDDEDNQTETQEAPTGRNRQLITRADGGLGMIGVSAAKKKEVAASEKREQARARRKETAYKARIEKQANSQKHFRDPLLQ